MQLACGATGQPRSARSPTFIRSAAWYSLKASAEAYSRAATSTKTDAGSKHQGDQETMNSSFKNQIFHGAGPTWANACVGENGDPKIFEYALGFASAATALLDSAIECEGTTLKVDTLVYPICFSMRHSVELFLKSFAASLATISEIRRTRLQKFNAAASHDLALIWRFVRESAQETDNRLMEPINKLERYIQDLSQIDATGQVFRYPFDINNKKHLSEVSIVNFYVLREQFEITKELLISIDSLTERLIEEYGQGTFTRSLSRHQLCHLATELPARETWTNESFRDIKKHLISQYNLSSTEFSKALHLIQTNHEMASHIGIQVPIEGLKIEKLLCFFDGWFQVHDRKNVITPPPPTIVDGLDFIEVNKRCTQRQVIARDLAKKINFVDFSAIEALFHFEEEAPFSEAFERLLKIHQRRTNRYKNHADEYQIALDKKLGSIRALERILYALDMLGQRDSIEALMDRYDLGAARDRLLERSRHFRNRT